MELAGQPLSEWEKFAIQETLKLTKGRRDKASKILQMSERTLYRRIKQYEIKTNTFIPRGRYSYVEQCEGRRKDSNEIVKGWYVHEAITNIMNEIRSLHTIRVPDHEKGFTEQYIVLPETVRPIEGERKMAEDKKLISRAVAHWFGIAGAFNSKEECIEGEKPPPDGLCKKCEDKLNVLEKALADNNYFLEVVQVNIGNGS